MVVKLEIYRIIVPHPFVSRIQIIWPWIGAFTGIVSVSMITRFALDGTCPTLIAVIGGIGHLSTRVIHIGLFSLATGAFIMFVAALGVNKIAPERTSLPK